MLKVKVKDFQAIKSADIAVEGITIIVGANDVGKTAMSRAIRSTLLNSSNDDMVRWGQSEFEVSIDVDGDNIVYGRSKNRSGAGVRVSYNGNSKTKVGREKLTDLFPDFPFQIKDVMGRVFFPHHVFQFELPVFSQVDVYEFFSSMFEKIDLMTQLSVRQKKFLLESRKAVESKVSILESWKSELAIVEDGLKEYDIPTVRKCEADYKELEGVQSKMDADLVEYDSVSIRLESLSVIDSVLGDVDLDALVEVYNTIDDIDVAWDEVDRLSNGIQDMNISVANLKSRVAIYKDILVQQDVLYVISQAGALYQSLEDNAGRQIKLAGKMSGIKAEMLLVEAGLLVEETLQVMMRVDYLGQLIDNAAKVRDDCKAKLAKIDVCPLCERGF
jgi:hypothetical protein